MSETTRLGLPLIEAGQAQKHVTHNEALRLLDALVQTVVVDRDLSAPPAAPLDGEAHIVAAAPTGAWLGQAGRLAARIDGVWTFLTPRVGWSVWVADENRPVTWTGAAWVPTVEVMGDLAHLDGVGIGTAPDATNRLSVRAAAALFAAEPAASGGSGDMRLTLEKESVGDTASLLFQTGWSGRAEIGLAGDDDLQVKVSSDGSTWADALRIAAATGQLIPGAAGIAGGGRLKSITSFGASGTWTRPTGVRWALVYVVGAGGGGGGAAGATSSGSAGSGGGAGGLAISFLNVTAMPSNTVTVGAGGTGGSTAGGNGGTGGSSSFGSEVSAAGGGGGTGMTAGTTAAALVGGTGGGVTSGDAAFTGGAGGAALRIDGTVVMAGRGGISFFAGGGRAPVANSNGSIGTARGSGGSGAAVSASATGRIGGAGAAGFVWIWEFE